MKHYLGKLKAGNRFWISTAGLFRFYSRYLSQRSSPYLCKIFFSNRPACCGVDSIQSNLLILK